MKVCRICSVSGNMVSVHPLFCDLPNWFCAQCINVDFVCVFFLLHNQDKFTSACVGLTCFRNKQLFFSVEMEKSWNHEELMNYTTMLNVVSTLVSCGHTMCTITGCFIMRDNNEQ